MSRKALVLAILLGTIGVVLVHAQPMPQSARQALIEMFSGKTPGGFEKHLPEVMLATLHKAPPGSAASMIEAFSLLSSQMQSHAHLQTFEAGPTLLITEDPQTNSKFEALVERDDLRGETDEIELSFRVYKDGESQTGGMHSRLVLALQQEQAVWRLHDITFSLGISLTDPTLLKRLSAPIKPSITTTSSPAQMSPNPAPNFGALAGTNEASATALIRVINTAEVTYVATYPTHGFTCTLSDLGGMGGGNNPDEHHALLIDPRLSNGRKNGYVFHISNCNGSPASSFSVTAAPADATSGTRSFCSDQSGVVRFSPDGNAASCLSTGRPLP